MAKNMNNISSFDLNKFCYGCHLCEFICPQTCIEFKESADGFLYPIIDENKCNKCGLCYKFCPISDSSISKNTNHPVVMGGWIKDEKVLIQSSSGGLFAALAKIILEMNGSVYGATFNQDAEIIHIKINNINEIKKIQGSKYIQSKCKNIYQKIKDDLNNNKHILFTGTPCQVAAVNNLFKTHENYMNLFLADIVCHGVNSPGVFKIYKDYLENKHQDRLLRINFRNKKFGWLASKTELIFYNKTISEIFDLNPFMAGFRKNIFLRSCCLSCKFASIPRYGDITMGDFWGVPKNNYNKNGVSLILLNNEKGKHLFELLNPMFLSFSSDIEIAKKRNPQLYKPSSINLKSKRIKDKFFEMLNEEVKKDYIFEQFIFGYPFPKLRKLRYIFKYYKKILFNSL